MLKRYYIAGGFIYLKRFEFNRQSEWQWTVLCVCVYVSVSYRWNSYFMRKYFDNKYYRKAFIFYQIRCKRFFHFLFLKGHENNFFYFPFGVIWLLTLMGLLFLYPMQQQQKKSIKNI